MTENTHPLRRYGRHLMACRVWFVPFGACSCGYQQALDAAEGLDRATLERAIEQPQSRMQP